ncbi:coiled-coil domain-containing protein 102A-like isoform X1 [Hydractinia symbiolongicarpus]|uniref:coiled-coil domain-containing protein 102A-like isoform X1 n=1 Tax=Hydractinia symbiolongicarpus TaxID=13093 RepID=UPI00254A5263|nr:coiled-coil domain-containing protein 102A-like isoform X1 [Hydractinia symbiolongicarpus]XP_057291316.1 coiled-coil domain-containing protein 102A-like isoform X1 [Hydractinia symbiolongicarpus]
MSLTREQTLLQELNEANIRTYQLEKTARWWSESTASWREKWGKVRSQRNKLRDDYVILKGQYTSLTKEYSMIKAEKDNLRNQLASLKPEKRIARIEPLLEEKINTTEEINVICNELNSPRKDKKLSDLPKEYALLKDLVEEDEENEERIGETGVKKIDSELINDKLSRVKDYVISCDEYVQAKNREIVKLESRNLELSEDYEKLQEQYIEDKKNSEEKPPTDKYGQHTNEYKIRELHREIQRLQQENCNEWRKREQCETDMIELRRELKCSHQTIQELKESLSRNKEETSKSHLAELNLFKTELEHKTHTCMELKSNLNRTRRQLQDKTDALNHEQKRTEHYESEIKKLRSRVDQLKKQILGTEEKIDLRENHIRRFQRSLEEQTQLKETLQSQVKHLTTRLKRQENMSRVDLDETSDDDEP